MSAGRVVRGLAGASAKRLTSKAIKHKKELQAAARRKKEQALKKDPAIARVRKQTAKNLRETRMLKKDLARGKKVLKKARRITGK